MVASEPTGEPAVLKGVIEVEVRIVAAGVVSDPPVVVVDVRHVRVTGHVGSMAPGPGRVSGWTGTVGWNVTAAEAAAGAAAATASVAATTTSLGKGGLSNHQEYDECSKELMHCSSAIDEGKHSAAETALDPDLLASKTPATGPRDVQTCAPILRLPAHSTLERY
jgi:hypothetical protein